MNAITSMPRPALPAGGPHALPGVPECAGRPRAGSGCPAVGRPAAPRRGPGLRLTARGRALVTGGVLLASLAGGMALTERPSSAAGERPAPRELTYVVAQPGQTLWEIARAATPRTDPRVTIEKIRDLNALAGVDIQAGQRIALP